MSTPYQSIDALLAKLGSLRKPNSEQEGDDSGGTIAPLLAPTTSNESRNTNPVHTVELREQAKQKLNDSLDALARITAISERGEEAGKKQVVLPSVEVWPTAQRPADYLPRDYQSTVSATPTVDFLPVAPQSLSETGLQSPEITDLALKLLLNRGFESGSRIATHLGLKFPVVEPLLRDLKTERLVVYRNNTSVGDYVYELTELGRERAKSLSEHASYFGSAPVPLEQYIESVKAQSIEGRRPPLSRIRSVFDGLEIDEELLSSIGQAIHAGRGMFLFGPPGNGKTSMAERITSAYGDNIWIPKAIVAAGETIRLFDPNRHQLMPVSSRSLEIADGRWVCIRRPTIIAGGELRMENLEITYIRNTGLGEAPLQMKANCGTLLIDDFGRQRMPIDELLNRWIVPLEQRHDYLQLESGRTIQVPFDQLIVFSSNLEPKDLVDDAFLRRIPYKIEVHNPNAKQFVELFLHVARSMDFECSGEVVQYLIKKHYVQAERPMRFCHPRDLLRQVENRCTLHELPRVITPEALDNAVKNYFSIMKPKSVARS
ncbi:MAG: AAA family ATPase [Planctomycetaceae bacterium]